MFNSFSGAYAIGEAQCLFDNRILGKLAEIAPDINSTTILSTGAAQIYQVFSSDNLEAVLKAYITGIKDIFAFALASAAFTVLLAMIIPFKMLPKFQDENTEN